MAMVMLVEFAPTGASSPSMRIEASARLAPVSMTMSATSNRRLPEEWREGLAEECGSEVTPTTFMPLLLRAERDVEDDRVDAGMREQDHRVGGVELVRAQDRLAVAFDRVDEAILPRAHVAPDAMERDHRALDDRAEADDRAGARKHLQRRQARRGPVPKVKTSLSAAMRVGADLGGARRWRRPACRATSASRSIRVSK